MKIKPLLALAAAATMVSGCVTTRIDPVEVTRFVNDSQPALGRGFVSISPGSGSGLGGGIAVSSGQAAAQAAVASELRKLGYTVAEGEAETVAEVWFEQVSLDSGRSRSPVGVGVGGSTGSYGSGVGVGLSFDLGGGGVRASLASDLRVRLRPAGNGPALWEGRAQTRAGGKEAAAGVAPARLAAALFAGFPGNSGETISVP